MRENILNVLNFKRFVAFTLAEVLIVIGVIGIIAEMTIPTLINDIQSQVYKVSYKKAFSVAQQAVTSAKSQDMFDPQDGSATIFNSNFIAFMNQFKTAKQCISGNGDQCWNPTSEKFYDVYPLPSYYSFVDASGFSWAQYSTWSNHILVDTNGFKKPNQWGKDMFAFQLIDPNYYSTSTPFNINDPNLNKGIPTTVLPLPDNSWIPCSASTVCATKQNYFGTSWLYQ